MRFRALQMINSQNIEWRDAFATSKTKIHFAIKYQKENN